MHWVDGSGTSHEDACTYTVQHNNSTLVTLLGNGRLIVSEDGGLSWCYEMVIIPDHLCDLCGYPLMTDGKSIECGNELCGRMTEYIKEMQDE